MHVESFAVGPLGCNCSIIADLEKKRAIVVDPGGDYDKIKKHLEEHSLTVDAIVHTHTHIDHVGATGELQSDTGAPASIHEADRFLYQILPIQAALIGGAVPDRAELEGSLADDRTLRTGDLEVAVFHTPGHTPGSCSFLVRNGSETWVFAGDTLFEGSIGRTDLWGGDSSLILKSIHNRLLTLPDDAIVITGHGPRTTIGNERATNPFLRR